MIKKAVIVKVIIIIAIILFLLCSFAVFRSINNNKDIMTNSQADQTITTPAAVTAKGIDEAVTSAVESSADITPPETAQTVNVRGVAVNDAKLQADEPAKNSYGETSSAYTFYLSSNSDKYIVTAEPYDNNDSMVTLYIEDNEFNLSSIDITAPDNYTIAFPYEQQYAASFCRVRSDTADDSSVPDILQIYFYADGALAGNSNYPAIVSKFYAIDNRTLKEIDIIDNTGGKPKHLDYTADTDFYYTEPLTLMPAIKVISDGKCDRPEIFTYTFNTRKFTMTKNAEEFSEDNPLYFGYGYYALADNIYRYFTISTYNVAAEEGYYEIPVIDSSMSSNNYLYSDYYFAVKDDRFNSVETLKAYMGTLFDKSIVDKMFSEAPQKYKDYDGVLHTVQASSGWPYGMGRLIITSYEKSDGDTEKSILYNTKQEILDEYGNVIDYADRGSFTIEHFDDISTYIPDYQEYSYSASPQGWFFIDYNYVLQTMENN